MSASKAIAPRKLIFVVPVFLLAIWFLLGRPSTKSSIMPEILHAEYKFETVGDVFLQDDPRTDWSDFDYTKHNFGLVNRAYETDPAEGDNLLPWARFDRFLKYLIASAPEDVSYKVLYMGRHGQGFHNVAESFYGTKAWDDHWSKLEGNGTVVWADAHLTDEGKEQVLGAHSFVAEQLSKSAMPAPATYYVSPLYRCLQTADLTWSGIELPEGQPFKPTIKELLRETNGEHTCDRRSSRTYIHRAFPSWPIESGFSEHDELWRADHRETHEEHDARTLEFLNELFAVDKSTYISLTSHSGAIASKLRVLKHREFRLPTGAMIPVLVKATKKSGYR